MNKVVGGIFDFHDRVQMETLNQRLERNKVITANVANSETPGFRAFGYDFEDQLQALADSSNPFLMKASDDKHFRNGHTEADGTFYPDVYMRPTESVSHDGNTVDVDDEMAKMAKNQILYQATVEFINRKVGILKYAIKAGGL